MPSFAEWEAQRTGADNPNNFQWGMDPLHPGVPMVSDRAIPTKPAPADAALSTLLGAPKGPANPQPGDVNYDWSKPRSQDPINTIMGQADRTLADADHLSDTTNLDAVNHMRDGLPEAQAAAAQEQARSTPWGVTKRIASGVLHDPLSDAPVTAGELWNSPVEALKRMVSPEHVGGMLREGGEMAAGALLPEGLDLAGKGTQATGRGMTKTGQAVINAKAGGMNIPGLGALEAVIHHDPYGAAVAAAPYGLKYGGKGVEAAGGAMRGLANALGVNEVAPTPELPPETVSDTIAQARELKANGFSHGAASKIAGTPKWTVTDVSMPPTLRKLSMKEQTTADSAWAQEMQNAGFSPDAIKKAGGSKPPKKSKPGSLQGLQKTGPAPKGESGDLGEAIRREYANDPLSGLQTASRDVLRKSVGDSMLDANENPRWMSPAERHMPIQRPEGGWPAADAPLDPNTPEADAQWIQDMLAQTAKKNGWNDMAAMMGKK